jgi:hypothetical protein
MVLCMIVGLPGMFKNLFHSSPGGDSAKHASELAPHRAEVEFALVLVEASASQQLQHTIKAVTGSAIAYGGTVIEILGSLIFVGFSGVPGCAPKSERQAFVTHVCSSYKLFVKVVHGKASALVGLVGSDTRLAYTVIPDDFSSIIAQLSSLARGEVVEHGAQQPRRSEPRNGAPM